jgi:predicted RNA-binding Zn ribbon-like protein
MGSDFALVGGDPSLDLVNTLVHHFDPSGPYELLDEPSTLLDWYEAVELIDTDARDSLSRRGKSLLASARDARAHLDTIYRSVIAQQVGRRIDDAIVELNGVLGGGRECVSIRRDRGAFHRDVTLEIVGFGDPIVQVAHCAAERLANLDALRLRECANPECDLIFYDVTRNGQRRWCDMSTCGNRLKQARHRLQSA